MDITLYFINGTIVEYEGSTIDDLKIDDMFIIIVHNSYKNVTIYNKNQLVNMEISIKSMKYLDQIKGLIHAN